MDLIVLILTLALVGCLVWLITTKIPMDPMFKLLIQIVVIVAVVLWLLRHLGVQLPRML